MRKLGNNGAVNVFLVLFLTTLVFFFASLGFGIWSYLGMQDYKNNVDEKIATAVEIAQQETATEKDNEFIEREKQPLKTYNSPSTAGSLQVKYPKTWSAYIDERSETRQSLDAYFNPNFVPDEDSDARYALRIQVTNESFDKEVKSYDTDISQGDVRAKPYKAANVDNVVGLQLDGEIESGVQGTMILLQLRDKTIKIWTEGDQFRSDMFDHVLANLTFSP